MDVPKKRIPRAEFHGIVLNFVKFRILQKNFAFWAEIRTFNCIDNSLFHKIQNYSMEFRPWNSKKIQIKKFFFIPFNSWS